MGYSVVFHYFNIASRLGDYMVTLTAGETLDENGNPLSGTGFEYDSEGPIAELLANRVTPLFSSPLLGEFAWGLIRGDQTNGEYERGAGVFPPGNLGPPEHIHPGFDEKFKIISGNFVIKQNGKESTYGPGDELTVKRGTAHTFRCVGDENGVLIAESWPASRLGEIACTLFGLAHEGKLGPKGQPSFWQGIALGKEYTDDFALPFPPPLVSKILITLLAPIAKLLGYQATDPRYLEDSYWLEHVNQPTG